MERHEVQSTVSAVTVYQGQAIVTRSASATLPAGPGALWFGGLPADLDRESIQVRGSGRATLGECTVETEHFSDEVDERRRDLTERRRGLQDKLEELRLRSDAGDKERGVLEKIVDFVTATPTASHPSAPIAPSDRGTADTWARIVTFYREQNQKIDRTGLEVRAAIRETEREIETVQARLDELGYDAQRRRAGALVRIEMHEAGDVAVELSYTVHGPTWRPVYSLRAASDTDDVEIEYDALVSQATAEEWADVALRLSTARVTVSGVLPELEPWRIGFFRPMPAKMRKKSARSEEYGEMERRVAPSMADSGIEDEDEPGLQLESAEVEAAATSVVFTVAGGGSVGGDNTEVRLPITRERLPGTFRHAAVPKLAEYAYLRSEIENTSQFPILPGRVNVFFDGAYIAASRLPLVMPGETTEVSLGVDEGVRIEHRFLKQFTRNEGLVSKRTSRQFDYQIRVTNNRARAIEITVYDQFPISEEKEITVKPLQPLLKDNEDWISIDAESKIEWRFTLEPSAVKELPYSVLAEYPVGTSPSGL